MPNMRELVESDLLTTLEGDWGLPVELVSPDGVEYTTSANDATQTLSGQVLYSSFDADPETGAPILVMKPVVTLRLSSLTRIPVAGETWAVRIPITPSPTATKESYLLHKDKAPFLNESIGFIKLYLQKVTQV